ncbi:MAG: cadherin-like domain-containing protein, partial [Acidimicrobiia bacterium]|nr:cadherin-like domain-containing protein [Acidimicrobiia bacterium]
MTTTTKTVAAIAFVLMILAAGLPADAQIQGDFPEVVLFASESMQIEASAEVFSGDVVVNQTSPGTLTYGNKAKTPSGYEVKANSIVVGNNVTLAGTEYCNAGNITCAPGGLGLPVYSLLPLFKASTPSGGNVTVAGGGSATVTGDALDITVAANGTLIFTPGVHNVRSITADNKTDIAFSGPTEVRVQNGMTLGLEGNVNRFSGAPAKDVVFYVGAGATLGSKGTVNANFYVANGTLEFPGNVIASGAFLAKNLVVGSKTQLTLASAFVNHPPMAVNDAITVSEDASATVINVLANDSDPDGDSIIVESVADPDNGTATTDGSTVSYEPDDNYFGVDVFNYVVCDDSTAINGNKCATATITVTVTSVNDAPTAADDSATTAEDNAVTVTVLANDNAGPANESQALTVTAV